MTKELEAFENIMKVYGDTNSLEGTYNDFLSIKKALQRLEAIDNANPSEALECFENMQHRIASNISTIEYATIKQALIKAQEQEKVLKVIKEKALPKQERDLIKQSENYEQYLIKLSWWSYKTYLTPKTEEEFELLKRYLK